MQENVSKQRDISYDILRILLCVFVIAIHTRPLELQNHEKLSAMILPIIYLCNPLFFMISGRFNLCKSFKDKKDIIKFYKNKIFQIVIPWLFYSIILYVWELSSEQNLHNDMKILIIGFLKKFVSNNISYHLWFMYALLGMLISTPFLSIMLDAMTDAQRKVFFIVATVWMIFLGGISNFGIEFGGNNFILNGWIYFYYAGWYIVQENEDFSRKKFLCTIAIAYIITVLMTVYYVGYAHNVDWALPYIIFTFSIYKFAISQGDFCQKVKREKLIVFLAKRVFSVYMIHVIVIAKVAQWSFIGKMNVCVRYPFVIGIVFIISVIIGTILDRILDFIINVPEKILCS